MKFTLSVFTLLAFQFVQAQVSEVLSVPVERSSSNFPSLKTSGDTINIPFRDEFSYNSPIPNPGLWADENVYINNHYPILPLGWGVATFDGLNNGGKAYDLDVDNSDTLADVLTSQHIDLTGAVAPYLSFVYQGGGLGDETEPGDSLIVDFWNVDSARWERVWRTDGGVNGQWNYAIVSADDPKWKKRGFRFRIGNYGALSGAFDIWNIDYVVLEANRNATDTIIEDPAWTASHPYLTEDFTKIPWFHESAISYRTELDYTYRRNGPVPSGGWSLNLGKYSILQDGVEIANRTTVPVVTNLLHDQELAFQATSVSVPVTAPTGEFTLSMMTYFDGEAVGVRRNDSLWLTQEFDNSYAYDDGSAENVYGLSQANSTLLFLFQPLVSDTMKGLRIYFGQAQADATQTQFRIVIYAFNAGVPGAVLYESDSLYSPVYMPSRDQFGIYELDIPGIFIGGAVFIGLKQLTATPLNVGFDRNITDLTQVVYGDGANWYPSIYPGTLMIRPYFRSTPGDLDVSEWGIKSKSTLKIWPNPNNGRFTVAFDALSADAVLYRMTGEEVWRGRIQSEIPVQTGYLPDGMYILRLDDGMKTESAKIIIRNTKP